MERTEELGNAAKLLVLVGGQLVELRTLSIEESEKWLGKVGGAIAGFDLPSTGAPGDIFASVAQQPVSVLLNLFVAYDVDKSLPPVAKLRKSMTQRELYDGLKQMVRAEAPFLEDARSVASAFGPQLRQFASVLLYQITQATTASRPANSMNTPLPNGDSIPEHSEPVSLRNDS